MVSSALRYSRMRASGMPATNQATFPATVSYRVTSSASTTDFSRK